MFSDISYCFFRQTEIEYILVSYIQNRLKKSLFKKRYRSVCGFSYFAWRPLKTPPPYQKELWGGGVVLLVTKQNSGKPRFLKFIVKILMNINIKNLLTLSV